MPAGLGKVPGLLGQDRGQQPESREKDRPNPNPTPTGGSVSELRKSNLSASRLIKITVKKMPFILEICPDTPFLPGHVHARGPASTQAWQVVSLRIRSGALEDFFILETKNNVLLRFCPLHDRFMNKDWSNKPDLRLNLWMCVSGWVEICIPVGGWSRSRAASSFQTYAANTWAKICLKMPDDTIDYFALSRNLHMKIGSRRKDCLKNNGLIVCACAREGFFLSFLSVTCSLSL